MGLRKEEEKKGVGKIKHEETFQNCHFLIYINKISTSTFWCMVTSLGPRLVYIVEKCSLTWDNEVVHDVHNP
jgi:hypothetical protein